MTGPAENAKDITEALALAAAVGSALIAIGPDSITVTPLDAPPTLQQLQATVGGYIELLARSKRLAFANEEGAFRPGFRPNLTATAYFGWPHQLFGTIALLYGVKVDRRGEFVLAPEKPEAGTVPQPQA